MVCSAGCAGQRLEQHGAPRAGRRDDDHRLLDAPGRARRTPSVSAAGAGQVGVEGRPQHERADRLDHIERVGQADAAPSMPEERSAGLVAQPVEGGSSPRVRRRSAPRCLATRGGTGAAARASSSAAAGADGRSIAIDLVEGGVELPRAHDLRLVDRLGGERQVGAQPVGDLLGAAPSGFARLRSTRSQNAGEPTVSTTRWMRWCGRGVHHAMAVPGVDRPHLAGGQVLDRVADLEANRGVGDDGHVDAHPLPPVVGRVDVGRDLALLGDPHQAAAADHRAEARPAPAGCRAAEPGAASAAWAHGWRRRLGRRARRGAAARCCRPCRRGGVATRLLDPRRSRPRARRHRRGGAGG